MAQLIMLDGLATCQEWDAKEIVFHGGTSLHLGWASPRFSEDLDFLVKRDMLAEMGKTMNRVVDIMRRRMMKIDPDLIIEIRDKSNPKMGRFNISISKDGLMGKCMVKSEFWGVEPEHLDAYRAKGKVPVLSASLIEEGVYVKLMSSLPIATLDSVFCDKIVAMAGRPFIKWRDTFDLWWISQSREFERPDNDTLAKRILYYATAYRNDPNSTDEDYVSENQDGDVTRDHSPSTLALRLRLYANSVEAPDMIEKSKVDLKRFLTSISGSTKVWDLYWPQGVLDMTSFAAQTAREIADGIDRVEQSDSLQSSLGRRLRERG